MCTGRGDRKGCPSCIRPRQYICHGAGDGPQGRAGTGKSPGSSHTPAQDTPSGSRIHPHPRTRSQQRWVGSLSGRHTGSFLPCSRSGHRHRATGSGHIHPHLGRGPLVLGTGSQLDRHSGMNPRCCRSDLARKAEAAGHIHPHLLHTPSHGSQPGKHSGKSRAGFRRPRGHRGPGSGCTRPHPGSWLRAVLPGTRRDTHIGNCLACSRSVRGHTAAARGGTRPHPGTLQPAGLLGSPCRTRSESCPVYSHNAQEHRG